MQLTGQNYLDYSMFDAPKVSPLMIKDLSGDSVNEHVEPVSYSWGAAIAARCVLLLAGERPTAESKVVELLENEADPRHELLLEQINDHYAFNYDTNTLRLKHPVAGVDELHVHPLTGPRAKRFMDLNGDKDNSVKTMFARIAASCDITYASVLPLSVGDIEELNKAISFLDPMRVDGQYCKFCWTPFTFKSLP